MWVEKILFYSIFKEKSETEQLPLNCPNEMDLIPI